MRIIQSMRGQPGPRCGRLPSRCCWFGEMNGTMKKAGKTVAYLVVPSLRFPSTSKGPPTSISFRTG